MADDNLLKNKVQEAYDAVKGLPAEESYKIEAFKLVLKSNLGLTTPARLQSGGGSHQKPDAEVPELAAGDWQTMISRRLNIEVTDVAKIYHLDDNGSLRLLLKNVPKSQSGATKDIAALLSAGRQAAKIDTGTTSFELVRAEVDDYGRLNPSNFTTYVRMLRPNFKIDGKGQEQTIKVTAPGFEQATEVAKKYLGQSAEK